MSPTTEPPVTVCEAAHCVYQTVEDAQIEGHRNLRLEGALGPQTVLLEDTLIDGSGAVLTAQLGVPALTVPLGIDRVEVRDLALDRPVGADDTELVNVQAEEVSLVRLMAQSLGSGAVGSWGDVLVVENSGSAILEDPWVVDNVWAGWATIVVTDGALVVRGGRIGAGSAVAAVIYASNAELTLDGVHLEADGLPAVMSESTDLTLIGFDQAWPTDQPLVSAWGGTVSILGGAWTSSAPPFAPPLILAQDVDLLSIDGTRFTGSAPQVIAAVDGVRRAEIAGAVLEGPVTALLGERVHRLDIIDSWFCGPGAPLSVVHLTQSCSGPCSVSGTVFSDLGWGSAVTVDGDLVVARTTVVGGLDERPVLEVGGHLALDRVILDTAAVPAVVSASLEVTSSALADTSELGPLDPDEVQELTPDWRGVATGPCGLDVQLADVPDHDWFAQRSVGAFPLCWADVDGDGLGDPATVLDAHTSTEGCPEGWVPVSGDCDDREPSVGPDCPAPNPGGFRLASGGCDTGGGRIGLGGLIAALTASWRRTIGRRRPALPAAARFG